MPYSINNLELAYIAGLFDGEGTITLQVHGWRKTNRRKAITPVFQISNTSYDLMLYLKKILPEGYIYKGNKPKTTRRQVWVFRSSKKSFIKNILGKLLPYLVVKKLLAELMLEYCTINSCSQGKRHYKYSDREIEIFRKTTELNGNKRKVNNYTLLYGS